jgi:lipid-A-disaccharide synthase
VSAPPAAPRIAVVAGEASGDRLGAGLIRALRTRLPQARFEGIGGTQMQAAGCHSLYPMEWLSVFGLTEVLGRFLPLLRLRRALARRLLADPPDLFIGVDSPGFNLGLEQRLRRAGIRTLHYVSPQLWAWRGWRIRKIRRAVDRMLVLFPFEADYYRTRGVAASFVGHPLADALAHPPERAALRDQLKLEGEGPWVALLPGSRASELRAHAELFVRTAQWLAGRHPRMQFLAPFVNRETRTIFERAVKRCAAWDLPLTRLHGHAHAAMGAADAVLLASGTAALEALLLRRPMVVTYRVSWPSYLLMRLLAQVKLYSLPNHLAGRALVPELVQADATPEKLGSALERVLLDRVAFERTLETYDDIARRLRQDADARAAEAAIALLDRLTPVRP